MTDTTLQDLLGTPGDNQNSTPTKRRKGRLSFFLPWLLLLGFGFLAWRLFAENLLPAQEIRLENVVTLRQLDRDNTEEISASNSAVEQQPESVGDPWAAPMLFQASGWVEPDPLPIKATALVNGVVDTVSVLEGESVKKGDLIASMIREDFELDLATAESNAAATRAKAKAKEAAIRAIDAKEQTLLKQVEAGNLRCLELVDRRDRLKRAGGGAVAEGEISQANLALQTHEGEVAALSASREELISQREQLVAEKEELEAIVREAETEVDRRQLALERTKVHAPVDGIILRLHAVPGQKRMLDMDDPDSSTVAVLFQPGFLQARIDVPLEEANQLSVGQAVRLRSGFLPGEIMKGIVTRIVGEADLQRNTLQTKVKIQTPDPRLRPDMLCRAEFLAPENGGIASGVGGVNAEQTVSRVSLFVPVEALTGGANETASVWTPDGERKKLVKRMIRLGSPERDGYRPVVDGLKPGDQVVMNPSPDLQEGDRFVVKEEEVKS